MTVQVAVCGPRDCSAVEADHAREVGRLLAERGVVVICGGGGGVMAAAASGARAAGGVVVGVRPGDTREGSSPDLIATLVTNMGEARNAVIVWSADAVVVVGGSWGTLSEVALAMWRESVPVVSLGGWRVLDASGAEVPGIVSVSTPAGAVRSALAGL